MDANSPPPAQDAPSLRLLFLETTAGCNLECSHCRRIDVARQLMKEDLTTGEILALIDSLARLGKPILVLSGGEPLLRPDIFEIARAAADRELPVALATNGTLIDSGKIAHQIKEAGIRRVAISLDGRDAVTHDRFRRELGSYEAALLGYRYLKEAGMSLQINTTVARHNRYQLDDMYRLVREIGADAWHLFMLVPVGCGLQIAPSEQLEAQTYEEILGWFADRAAEGALEMRATCAPHYYRILRQKARGEGRTQRSHNGHGMAAHTKGCLAGTGVAFVSHKGDVFPCGYLPLSCGSVHQRPFDEIWSDSAVFQTLRDSSKLQGKCGICEYKNICGGCRARAFSERGDICAEEPYCVYEPKSLLLS